MYRAEAEFLRAVGIRLQQARVDADMERADLALLTGFSEDQIMRWEHGIAELSCGQLDMLAEMLDVTTERLSGLEEDGSATLH